MNIAFDIGHIGRWNTPEKYIRRPAEHAGLREDVVSLQAATACASRLLHAGHDVAFLGWDTYGSRQRRYHGDLYVAWHANASSYERVEDAGDYGLVLGLGAEWERYGEAVAEALRETWPCLDRVLVEPAGPPRWSEGTAALLSTAASRGIPALLLEPGFLDSPQHAALWQAGGPERTGEAVARALLELT